jgi:hypothetical protein
MENLMELTHWQKMANLIFDLEKKVINTESSPALLRIHDKMKQVIEDSGIYLCNPTGERYSETRTDVDANISGESTNDLIIKDVIKPILYLTENGTRKLLQKGVVVVSERYQNE